LTGKDAPVAEFLKREQEVERFLEQVFALVGQSIRVYSSRGFTHLAVNFGCTGGQHRSVYCAETLASRIREHFGVKVMVIHREIGRS
jgi:RNase adaptor protein for sRNA GlmZ degradation